MSISREELQDLLEEMADDHGIVNFMFIYETEAGLHATGRAAKHTMTYQLQGICKRVVDLCKEVAVQVLHKESTSDTTISLSDALTNILKEESE